jgi:hypothetical protein
MRLPIGRLFLLHVLLFTLLGQAAFASAVRFERLSIEDGLSQSSILCIVQDSQGVCVARYQQGPVQIQSCQ